MRRLLESLTPDARRIYWQWVGGMFALYVVLLLTAAGVFVGHESSRKLAQEPVTTVAIDGKQRSISEVSRRCGRPRGMMSRTGGLGCLGPARNDSDRGEGINGLAALIEHSPFHQHDALRLCPRWSEANNLSFEMERIAGSHRRHPA